MKTVLILVDALRSDYLTPENMPYLFSLAKTGTYVSRVKPSFGFCERTEIFTGVPPCISGNLFAIGHDPDTSEYAHEKRFLLRLSKLNFADKYIRYLYYRFFRKSKAMGMYRIPMQALHNFALTEDGSLKYGQFETITEILAQEKMTFDLSRFTSLSNSTENRISAAADNALPNFVPIYIGEIDSYGHLYADSIEMMRPYLIETDKRIKEIIMHYMNSGDYRFVILGDHGMEPVTQEVDVISAVKSVDAVYGREYEIFVDSTACRVWCFSEDVKDKMRTVLEEKCGNYGRIVDSRSAKERHADIDILSSTGTHLYGDLLWCADIGVLIHPDYYNGSKMHDKGMHGYFDVGSYSYGLAVFSGIGIEQREIEECSLFDICPSLCDMLEIRKTKGCVGKSIFNSGG